jgi:hypothetical protein
VGAAVLSRLQLSPACRAGQQPTTPPLSLWPHFGPPLSRARTALKLKFDMIFRFHYLLMLLSINHLRFFTGLKVNKGTWTNIVIQFAIAPFHKPGNSL